LQKDFYATLNEVEVVNSNNFSDLTFLLNCLTHEDSQAIKIHYQGRRAWWWRDDRGYSLINHPGFVVYPRRN
jgi:hypothetical protein